MRNLKVFKFGGASVKSADGVRNILSILELFRAERLVVVVSAMGKTTNALERILDGYMQNNGSYAEEFEQLKNFHLAIAHDLWGGTTDAFIFSELHRIFSELEKILSTNAVQNYDYCYDQIVSFGEIISTTIVSQYINFVGLTNIWVDARECLRTDTSYREGVVDFNTSKYLCQKIFDCRSCNIFITQGFIAGTAEGTTTTLGREGSDYTAAILANLLGAVDVTIWKDVAGVLNADPKIFSNTQKLDFVSYQEAIELAYCGAQIIHPKTIKPLQNKDIPLYVKSFLDPTAEGTVIANSGKEIEMPPVLVLKRNQVLISLVPRDFSFVIEDSLSKIFALLYKHRVKVNLVQNSAISFTICVDEEKNRLPGAIDELREDFVVRYNSNLEMLTIRHYTNHSIKEYIGTRVVYLQQRTRTNARFIMDM